MKYIKFIVFMFITCLSLISCAKEEDSLIQIKEAIDKENVSLLKKIVKSDDSFNKVNDEPLVIYALKSDKPKAVEELLRLGMDISASDQHGMKFMHWAARFENTHYLKLGVRFGGSVDAINTKKKTNPTPIFEAINAIELSNVEYLIKEGANINVVNSSGETPLIVAAGLNRYDIVYILLEAGADFRVKDNWGKTVLYPLKNNAISKDSELYQWKSRVIAFLEKKGVQL